MSKPGSLPILDHFTTRENNNWWYLLKYPIFHVDIVSEYTLRYNESCVWISVEMNKYFWCYIRKPGFQFQNSRPGPGFTTHFTESQIVVIGYEYIRFWLRALWSCSAVNYNLNNCKYTHNVILCWCQVAGWQQMKYVGFINFFVFL